MRCPDHVGAVEVLGRELLWLKQVNKGEETVTPILSSVTPVVNPAGCTAFTPLFATNSGFSSVRT